VLDTEGAAQNLQGKPGIHRRIQVVQSISLRTLIQAMEEVRKQGKPGDTVLLDSISKIFQAMRAYAQQRAGSETDRKTNIGFDEHASVNRNMQAVYTALSELKQAGFHVVIIGHLARKYRANEGNLHDDGLRVLADEQIAYEADAILLVEREGEERSITPIVKPPRPAHLKLDKRYPATLGTLYPDLAEATTKGKGGKAAAPAVDPAAEEALPAAEPAPAAATPIAATPVEEVPRAAAPAGGPPRDPAEAEQRFFARYSEVVGGSTWQSVQRYLGHLLARPSSVEGWIAVAEEVRDKARTAAAA
jgi:hypothetical protein